MIDDEQKTEQSEERDEDKGNGSDENMSAQEKIEAESEQAKEKVRELEDDPPAKLEDWPDDEAKYETFGGPEGEHSYDEGPEKNLGPSSLRHREGGGVEIEGEEADNPEEFKSDPIPGGPTDKDAPAAAGERDLSDESSASKGDDDSDGDGDSGDSGEDEGDEKG